MSGFFLPVAAPDEEYAWHSAGTALKNIILSWHRQLRNWRRSRIAAGLLFEIWLHPNFENGGKDFE